MFIARCLWEGKQGKVYEIMKFILERVKRGGLYRSGYALDSQQNNVRPYIIPDSKIRLCGSHGCMAIITIGLSVHGILKVIAQGLPVILKALSGCEEKEKCCSGEGF